MMKMRKRTRVRIFRTMVAAALLIGAICAAAALCWLLIRRLPILTVSAIAAVLLQWAEGSS